MKELHGYDQFSRAVLRRWIKAKGAAATAEDAAPVAGTHATWATPKARGRRVDKDFEATVLDQLCFTTVEVVNKGAQKEEEDGKDYKAAHGRLAASCLHSYDVIRKAALTVRDKLPEQHGARNLKFSNKWIKGFLRRFRFSRQAITKVRHAFTESSFPALFLTFCPFLFTTPQAQKINRPSPAQVEQNNKIIQAGLQKRAITLSQLINYDETSGLWGLNTRFTYAPIGGGGAAGPGNEERQRLTIGVGLFADGNHLPPSFIIKCSTENDDQSSTTVLDKLLRDPTFNTDQKWERRVWQRSMAVGKPSKVVMFKRPYLRHADGRVVWAQHKAYQDTPGLAMWCDLVLGPARRASGDAWWALVWDNCASHLVPSVLAVYQEWCIDVYPLSPNMTDLQQPVDIVACGPMKTLTKRARTDQLYDYFQRYRANCLEQQRLLKYNPPQPTMPAFISLMSGIFSERFLTEEFMGGVRRVFQAVALAPYNAAGDYHVYESHKGTFPLLPRGFRGTVHKNLMEAEELLNDVALVRAKREDQKTLDDYANLIQDLPGGGLFI